MFRERKVHTENVLQMWAKEYNFKSTDVVFVQDMEKDKFDMWEIFLTVFLSCIIRSYF